MSSRKKIILFGGLILILQLIVFKNYLFPSLGGQIRIKGLACTCPDETVVEGQAYLISITPDSLKKYNLDFTEIYVDKMPTTDWDPYGYHEYVIKGKVIGKDRVAENSIYPWNPKVKIEEWHEVDTTITRLIESLLIGQTILIGIVLLKTKKINGA